MTESATTCASVMVQLEALGTEQNRKVFGRHGARDPMFGVSYANLAKLRKQIGVDHRLAEQLWATGNHDARVLAMKVADPTCITVKQADAWMRDCDNYTISEALAAEVARAPAGVGRARVWRARAAEWPRATGWCVTANLALAGVYTDRECTNLLTEITRELQTQPNRVRHEMNATLIAIGVRPSDVLRERALAAAAKIGPVVVDHGATSCKTPDAATYITKTWSRAR